MTDGTSYCRIRGSILAKYLDLLGKSCLDTDTPLSKAEDVVRGMMNKARQRRRTWHVIEHGDGNEGREQLS